MFNQHNRVWALDFVHDALYDGRRFRVLNIIDESNREALAVEPGFSIPAARLIRVMNRLVDFYGLPDAIRCDNGAEMAGHAFRQWAEDRGVQLMFIQPGKPNQMHLPKDSTEPSGMKCWTLICLHQCGKWSKSATSGARNTTRKDHTNL